MICGLACLFRLHELRTKGRGEGSSLRLTLSLSQYTLRTMSRPLRIEFRDAWYHVMNRGRRGEPVFIERSDYLSFLDVLKETRELWQLRIAAYCLMPNHYHLLVQTPRGNISRCMRHIDGVYTQRFNRRHATDGPLFRGRYKALLVDADSLSPSARALHPPQPGPRRPCRRPERVPVEQPLGLCVRP